MSIIRGLLTSGNQVESSKDDFRDISGFGLDNAERQNSLLGGYQSPFMNGMRQSRSFRAPGSFGEINPGMEAFGSGTSIGQQEPGFLGQAHGFLGALSPKYKQLSQLYNAGSSALSGDFSGAGDALMGIGNVGNVVNIGKGLSSLGSSLAGGDIGGAGAAIGNTAGLLGGGSAAGSAIGGIGGGLLGIGGLSGSKSGSYRTMAEAKPGQQSLGNGQTSGISALIKAYLLGG